MRNGPFEAVRRQAMHHRRLAAERHTWDRFAGAYLANRRKRDDEDEARIDELARRHVEGHGGIDADLTAPSV